jgi:chorismate synthase
MALRESSTGVTATPDQNVQHADALRPAAILDKERGTVNTAHESVTLAARGRHDPCVLPRAVPMVEAMVALVLVDHSLRQRAIAGE